MNPEHFSNLASRFKPLWLSAELERLDRPDRKHAMGQGRKYKLSTIEDKLLMLLIFRLYPDLTDVIVDATEQPKERHSDKTTQKEYYSGKKKRHSLKTQIVISKNGTILDVSASHPGSIHDYTIFKEDNLPNRLPEGSILYMDKGYDGAKDEYPDHPIALPIKKRRNHQELTLEEQTFNKEHSKFRITVKHVLSRMKKYQILYQTYRHQVKDYNQRFRNVAALVNFRMAQAAA